MKGLLGLAVGGLALACLTGTLRGQQLAVQPPEPTVSVVQTPPGTNTAQPLPGTTVVETMPGAPIPGTSIMEGMPPFDCQKGCGLSAGASIYFLKPFINNNPAFITTTDIGSPNSTQTTKDFSWDCSVSPAGWIGWSGPEGFGAQFRFFHFDQASNSLAGTLDASQSTTTITPPPGLSPVTRNSPNGFSAPGNLRDGTDLLNAGSDLRIQTMDFEATYLCQWANGSILLSGGGRYLQMSQNYSATLSNVVDETTFEHSSLTAGHNFYGGGPTLGVTGRWCICQSCFAIFGSVRGSLLVGDSKQTATFSEVIRDTENGNQNNLGTNRHSENRILPVTEIELGVECGKDLSCTHVFARGAAVNKTFFDAGSASSRDGNVSLFGGQVSVGINY